MNKFKPDYILINLGGGKQEILGLYLKQNLKFKVPQYYAQELQSLFIQKIKRPITSLIDRLYLGWFKVDI